MIDRAALLATVLNRNAVRRSAFLPPLDVRAEYQRAVAIAIDAEVRALAEVPPHKQAVERIVAEVRDEMFRKHGIKGETFAARLAVGQAVSRRVMDYLRAVYGSQARAVPTRHPIRYGATKVHD